MQRRIKAEEIENIVFSYSNEEYNAYKGVYQQQPVKLKIFSCADKKVNRFAKELLILKSFQSQNILNLYGYIFDERKSVPIFGTVTEYASLTLREYLNQDEHLSYEGKTMLMLDAAKGLQALHTMYENPYLHKNVSSSSFYISSNRVKIGSISHSRDTKVNFMAYFSYEILKDIFFEYTIECEIYSFGIVLWEILTRRTPFKNLTYGDIYNKLIIKNRGSALPLDAPLELQMLITMCRDLSPKKRPTTDYIVSLLVSLR
ncbi:ORF-133 [Teiidae poxvirus 1]|nr:ORF-133 [Teiidae poxvirus 1]